MRAQGDGSLDVMAQIRNTRRQTEDAALPPVSVGDIALLDLRQRLQWWT